MSTTIDQFIELFEKEIRNYNLPECPKNLYEPISYTLEEGGKRIRPLLVYIGSSMFSDSVEDAAWAALAIEIFHNFTLLHDDIMDNADVRRGKASVHKKWGVNVAILSGDVMVIKAYEALSKVKSNHFRDILASFNKLATLVCEGQQYDMDFESRDNVDIEDYLKMITLKTSALIAGALEIGAFCGGAPKRVCDYLYKFGIGIGNAFQLQDDLLDTFGDPATFGKRIGGDIIEGKKTYLWLSLLKTADENDRCEAMRVIGSTAMSDEEKIEAVKELYDKYSIKEMTQWRIDSYFKESIAIIESLNIPQKRKEAIYELANILIKRQK